MGILDDVDLNPFGASPPGEFSQFLDQGGRAAMMSAGLQMMMPRQIGGNFLSQLAESVGAGGEALTRGQEQDRKQAESDSKVAAREQKLSLAEQRLGLQRERMNMKGMNDLFKRKRTEQMDAAEEQAIIDSRAPGAVPAGTTLPGNDVRSTAARAVTGNQRAAILAKAQKALDEGAPEEAVRARLKAWLGTDEGLQPALSGGR